MHATCPCQKFLNRFWPMPGKSSMPPAQSSLPCYFGPGCHSICTAPLLKLSLKGLLGPTCRQDARCLQAAWHGRDDGPADPHRKLTFLRTPPAPRVPERHFVAASIPSPLASLLAVFGWRSVAEVEKTMAQNVRGLAVICALELFGRSRSHSGVYLSRRDLQAQ